MPSNVATQTTPAAAALVRERLSIRPETLVVGHFGTFGGAVVEALAAMFPAAIRVEGRAGLLLGRGADAFRARLAAAHPELGARLHAAADLDAEAVAEHVRASDLMLQPYPDGVSSRRGSVMAGLAVGMPAVTSEGALTEPIWRMERLVLQAPAGDVAAHLALVDQLLGSSEERRALGERAAIGYACRFSVEQMVHRLRSASKDA